MSESVRDRVVRVLDLAGACCGQCGREPGSPLADCPDCGRVLGGYAGALAAAGLLRDALPPAIERDDSLARLLTGEHMTDQERRELADLRERMEVDRG